MTTHVYDGTPNDGFCGCGKPSHDPVHAMWKTAWQRSLRIQCRLQAALDAEARRGMDILAANTSTRERAQQDYDVCLGRTA